MAIKSPAPRQPAAKGKSKKSGKRRKESILAKIARKLFKKKAEEASDKYEVANPMYEYNEEGREVERPLPHGLTQKEAKVLKQVRKNAYKLDYTGCCGCGCSCCGLRLGKTTMFGVIPALGPIIDVTLGVCKVNLKAQKVDLPCGVKLMLYVRHGISEIPGLVPFVGGLWIAWYKVNSRNSFAFERYLEERVRERRKLLGAE
ncbi:hypothetical protein A7U60_g3528 [Sanghuangporus baumii]|uniref:Uncharacterized protein n=1 Tax=Sanghuangporus baumii TaxID=108892 RepID=A0A9Q5N6S8_SANBA|nr:hypothetical protein A7U60_g3528 [Sanghuangporus baumii]